MICDLFLSHTWDSIPCSRLCTFPASYPVHFKSQKSTQNVHPSTLSPPLSSISRRIFKKSHYPEGYASRARQYGFLPGPRTTLVKEMVLFVTSLHISCRVWQRQLPAAGSLGHSITMLLSPETFSNVPVRSCIASSMTTES